jgi:hypothetical protein
MSAPNAKNYLNHAQKIDAELATIPVGHPLRELLETAARLLQEAASDRAPSSDVDATRVALIDKDYHWNPIDGSSPHGSKMQLINRRYGVAIYGSINSREQFFTHWAPLPTFRD